MDKESCSGCLNDSNNTKVWYDGGTRATEMAGMRYAGSAICVGKYFGEPECLDRPRVNVLNEHRQSFPIRLWLMQFVFSILNYPK